MLQRGADAEGALLHGFCNQLAHLLELGACRGTVIFSDHIFPQASSADKRA